MLQFTAIAEDGPQLGDGAQTGNGGNVINANSHPVSVELFSVIIMNRQCVRMGT